MLCTFDVGAKLICQGVMKLCLHFINLTDGRSRNKLFHIVVSFCSSFSKQCSYHAVYVYTHGRSWNIWELNCLHSEQIRFFINSCCQAVLLQVSVLMCVFVYMEAPRLKAQFCCLYISWIVDVGCSLWRHHIDLHWIRYELKFFHFIPFLYAQQFVKLLKQTIILQLDCFHNF